MNEDDRNSANYKAERAKMLLEDPMVKGALDTIKQAVREQIFALDSGQREQREFLFMIDKARQQFERVFTLIINEAQVHNAEYAQEAQIQARYEAVVQRGRER